MRQSVDVITQRQRSCALCAAHRFSRSALGIILALVVGPGPADAQGLHPRAATGRPDLERVASSTTRSDLLYMPYFKVSPSTGVVALFALRNVTSSQIFVSTTFTLFDGTVVQFQDSIDALATLTVNLNDVQLPTSANGTAEGSARFAVVNAGSTTPNGNQALIGDYFFVDPGNDFATGDRLVTDADRCNRFSTRFADGGVFNGTTFNIVAPSFVPAASPSFSNGLATLFSADVYDEAGVAGTGFSGDSAGNLFATSTAVIGPQVGLPTFGSIEWTFADGQTGFVTWSMNAGGRFSVGMLGTCLD